MKFFGRVLNWLKNLVSIFLEYADNEIKKIHDGFPNLIFSIQIT